MVNTAPVIGRNGEVWIASKKVGYLKGFTLGISRGTIKDYKYESDTPAILAAGNSTFSFSADSMWIDKEHADQVLAGTAITIEIAPESSTPTGQTKITLTSAVLTSWTLTSTQDGVVVQKIAGEAKTLAFTTY
jgi:hypothetical protein